MAGVTLFGSSKKARRPNSIKIEQGKFLSRKRLPGRSLRELVRAPLRLRSAHSSALPPEWHRRRPPEDLGSKMARQLGQIPQFRPRFVWDSALGWGQSEGFQDAKLRYFEPELPLLKQQGPPGLALELRRVRPRPPLPALGSVRP